MQITISRTELARAVGAVGKVIETRHTIPILSCVRLAAADGHLTVTGTDLDIVATTDAEADVRAPGAICVDAKLLGDIARKAGNGDVTLSAEDERLEVKSGRSKFNLAVLPASDFPDLAAGSFDAEFDLDMAAMFSPVAFAISTEETRHYLNGVFFRGGESVAVATDGHRLARNSGPVLPDFAGVIVPRKAVGLLPKGIASVAVSQSKIRIVGDGMTIVSKLIDGTFPDYERVIPRSNDKVVTVDRDAILQAADRVVTISTVKGRGVKLSLAPGSIVLTARSDVGEATDEIAAEYSGEPFDIGLNAAYLRDLLSVLPAGQVKMAFADAGSPGLITGGLETWTGVVMPMRV